MGTRGQCNPDPARGASQGFELLAGPGVPFAEGSQLVSGPSVSVAVNGRDQEDLVPEGGLRGPTLNVRPDLDTVITLRPWHT